VISQRPVRPWRTIDQVETPEGPLELRRRGERDFLITIAGRVLMTSAAHRSEDALAELACAGVREAPRPRLLLGGLGMGYTLRAALDQLQAGAALTVVDLNPTIVDWCRGPLAALTGNALADRRNTVQVANVARVIASARPGAYDVILLDLYEGPHQATNRAYDPLYGAAALARTWRALRPAGVFAVWSEEADHTFEERLAAAGFSVRSHRPRGGRVHVVYIASRLGGGVARGADDRKTVSKTPRRRTGSTSPDSSMLRVPGNAAK
jgi:spermidine synthase